MALALVLSVAAPALAEPPPAAVQAPAERTVVIRRETLETIMAEAETAEPTRQLLLQCQADVAKLAAKEPEPASWWTALKWGAIGGVVVTAFVAGVMVGH
jgi:hypothetical protein